MGKTHTTETQMKNEKQNKIKTSGKKNTWVPRKDKQEKKNTKEIQEGTAWGPSQQRGSRTAAKEATARAGQR